MDAIQKVGCEVHDFFVHAPHAVQVEEFDPHREAYRFNRFRAEGVIEHPQYEIPTCIMSFADMVHSATCPRKFFADLRAKTQARILREARAMQAV
ncbi:MAG: hypothetical protein NTV60_02215 [Candidatus Kaiserbacteria bacterium]|nr:hypothetical protein [Candidatus Kaiserbacteria bacterium]